MAFWIILPVLTILALAFVVIPLLRTGNAASLSTAAASRHWSRRTLVLLALGLAAIVAIPAIALYASVGRPDLAMVEARATAATVGTSDASPDSSIADMIAKLRDKVRQTPKDTDAWQTLGWAYMHIRQPADAVDAYKHVVALAPDSAENRSALAEATIQSGSGKISEATLADLQKVVAADPADARARFYLALYKDQQGDHKSAIADWITLIKSAPPNAAWASEVRGVVEQVAKEQHIDVSGQIPSAPDTAVNTAEVTPGPNAEQVAAAQKMPAGDRNAMIHGMVDKLAAELKKNPHDTDGWLRLMRARMVLGEKPQALGAYHDARATFANDPAQLSTIDTTAHTLGIAGG
jgi:cytochrome c-type biogenesis protein CcmH